MTIDRDEILGTDTVRDALKTKTNDNFIDTYSVANDVETAKLPYGTLTEKIDDLDTRVDDTDSASDSAAAAALSETNAGNSETAAKASEDAAAISETNAGVSETNSETARDFSEKWSSEDENVLVDDGVNPPGYSAFHWSLKAAATTGLQNVENRQMAVNSLNLSAEESFDEVINNTTYVGDGLASRVVSQPVDMGSTADHGGMYLSKNRNVVGNWRLYDTLSGLTNYLKTNAADAEAADAIVDFNPLTINASAEINGDGNDIFCQTIGTTAKISVPAENAEWHYNVESGFAMCEYTGDGLSGKTLTHPMGTPLKYCWVKDRGLAIEDWPVLAPTHLGAQGYLHLNTNQAKLSSELEDDDHILTNTSTEITIGARPDVNEAGSTYTLYAWFGGDLTESGSPEFGEGVKKSWALYMVPAGSGVHTFNTEVEGIHTLITKSIDTAGSHWASGIGDDFSAAVELNDTAVETISAQNVVDSIVKINQNASTDKLIMVLGSGTPTGVTNQLTLNASSEEPAIITMADGFDETGNKDLVAYLTSNIQSTNVLSDGWRTILYSISDSGLYLASTPWEVSLEGPDYSASPTRYIYLVGQGKLILSSTGDQKTLVMIGEALYKDGEIVEIKTYPNTKTALVKNWFEVVTDAKYILDNPFGNTEIDVEVYWSLTGTDEDSHKVNLISDGTVGYGCSARKSKEDITIGTGIDGTFRSTETGDPINSVIGYYKITATRRF